MATSSLRLATDEPRGDSPGLVLHPRSRGASSSLPRRVLVSLVDGVRDNAVLFAVLVPFAAAALLVQAATGVPVAVKLLALELRHPFMRTLSLAIAILAGTAGWFAVLRLRARARMRSGELESLPDLRTAWQQFPWRPTIRGASRFFVCLMAYAVFLFVFVGFKGAIPIFHPFALDEVFMGLDRALHFGRDPWRLLQPLFGQPLMTKALDVLYYVWFTVNILMVAWFAWREDTRERRRFFLTYLLAWVLLGNVAALALSSAGPCFFDLATGALGPYAEQMAYLRGVDVSYALTTLEVQGMLLAAYNATEVHAIEGIAAMPSLHVAMPFVFAMVTSRSSRVLSRCFVVFGILILIGSVHLGWHYAVDGYAAILGALAIYGVVDRALPTVSAAPAVSPSRR